MSDSRPRGPYAESSCVEIADAHHPLRIAIDDADELREQIGDERRVQHQVGRPFRERTHPICHAVSIGCHLRPELAQAGGIRLAGRRDHACAAQQRDLHGGEAHHRPAPVDEDRLARRQSEQIETAHGGLHGHGQRGGVQQVQALRNLHPDGENCLLCDPGGGTGQEIGHAEDAVADHWHP